MIYMNASALQTVLDFAAKSGEASEEEVRALSADVVERVAAVLLSGAVDSTGRAAAELDAELLRTVGRGTATAARERGPRWSSPKKEDRGRPGRWFSLSKELHVRLDELKRRGVNLSAFCESALRGHPDVDLPQEHAAGDDGPA